MIAPSVALPPSAVKSMSAIVYDGTETPEPTGDAPLDAGTTAPPDSTIMTAELPAPSINTIERPE